VEAGERVVSRYCSSNDVLGGRREGNVSERRRWKRARELCLATVRATTFWREGGREGGREGCGFISTHDDGPLEEVSEEEEVEAGERVVSRYCSSDHVLRGKEGGREGGREGGTGERGRGGGNRRERSATARDNGLQGRRGKEGGREGGREGETYFFPFFF